MVYIFFLFFLFLVYVTHAASKDASLMDTCDVRGLWVQLIRFMTPIYSREFPQFVGS